MILPGTKQTKQAHSMNNQERIAERKCGFNHIFPPLVFVERFCVCSFWQWDSLPCQGILENVSNHLKQKSKYRLSKSKCLSKFSLFYVQIHKKSHLKRFDHPKNSIRTVLPTKSVVFFSENPKRTSHPLIPSIVGIPAADSFPLRLRRRRPKGRDVGKAIRNLCAMALYAELQQPVVPKEAVDVNPFRGDRRVVRGLSVLVLWTWKSQVDKGWDKNGTKLPLFSYGRGWLSTL